MLSRAVTSAVRSARARAGTAAVPAWGQAARISASPLHASDSTRSYSTSPILNTTTSSATPSLLSTPFPLSHSGGLGLRAMSTVPSPNEADAPATGAAPTSTLESLEISTELSDLDLVDESPPWLPIRVAMEFLDTVHDISGAPWWLVIAGAAVVVRTAVFPLAVMAQQSIANSAVFRPDIERYQQRIKATANPQEKMALQQELFKFMSVNKANPLRSLVPVLVQMPLFITLFITVRRIASDAADTHAGLSEEGLLWFTDLTQADPMHVLPVISCCMFLFTGEYNYRIRQLTTPPQTGGNKGIGGFMSSEKGMATMQNVMRVIAVTFIPITMNMPSAVFCYWIANNSWTAMQVWALNQQPIRDMLNIKPLVYYRTREEINERKAKEKAQKEMFKKMKKARSSSSSSGDGSGSGVDTAAESRVDAIDGAVDPRDLAGAQFTTMVDGERKAVNIVSNRPKKKKKKKGRLASRMEE
eukprot:TRINITY_DN692_c0_g2_i1.p1 TRINITY_DN692_c0_g2~~TRINITY_DN692_c0_g2_i1.p1  ORF type:complete len:473 (+),score=109.47 TRINITY_DN692_c0_g2_i1:316-1734(+)